jgi:hypothetical protein
MAANLAPGNSHFDRELAQKTRAMRGPVVRVSLGSFDADKAAVVEAKLIESKVELEAGIRACVAWVP